MTVVPDGLRVLAEEMFAIVPPPPGANREVSERWVLHAPESGNVAFTGVMRVRLPDDDVHAAVEELRDRFGAAGRRSVAWWVGPSARPAGLAGALRDLGFAPLEHPAVEPRYEAMVLLDEPEPPPAGVTARQVADIEEFRAATRIYWQVVDPDHAGDLDGPSFAVFYRDRHLSGDSVSYLAWVDDTPAATANAHFTADGGALSGG